MLVTKKKYAELCGCDIQSIYNRERNGHIKYTTKKVSGVEIELVDIKKFPPLRLRKPGGGRKKKVVKSLKRKTAKKKTIKKSKPNAKKNTSM